MNRDELVFIVYSRIGCHLCEIMLTELSLWQQEYKFRIESVDIDSDREIQKKYAARIPLLVAEDVEICEYHFDKAAFLAFIDPPAVSDS